MKVESDTAGSWRLSGHVDLDSLMHWREQMELAIPADQDARIDLADLQIDGSAILSLLVFLVRRAQLAGVDIRFENPSNQLLEMADMAELSALLKVTTLK